MTISKVTCIVTKKEMREIETYAKSIGLYLQFLEVEPLGQWNDRKYQITMTYCQEDGAYSKWRNLLRKFTQ